ncbi:transposase Tn5 [Legionella shakespearei DSM 23087]|uniref:Transposase Tn5 n=1 Tax=Legionella shakespearei DSM 23087 TaxID=1122169 RepID=A0A0W0Z4T8_9GAMM|nr:transposase Tn5 [Legionella shakespearei DSM 23087]
MTPNRIIHTEQARVKALISERHVLAIQDTTENNYQSKAGRVKGLGTVGNGTDAGFFLHPLIVLDAHTGGAIGCAEVTVWNRTKEADEQYQQLPIEEKESYRWISTAESGAKVLSKAASVTFIGDRESDIYEYMDRIPKQNTHIITRTRCDRLIVHSDYRTLYDYLDNTKEAGRISVSIRGDERIERQKREALLSIKYGEIEIKRPKKCTDKCASPSIKLWVVEAKEIECPAGQDPIHWRLYTSHPVASFEQAQQIIIWYQMRWNIEQVFRTTKSKGFDIEQSQVESGESLMKLSLFALFAALKVIQLVTARDGSTELKTSDLFTPDEQVFLRGLLVRIQGKTIKQQNPYPEDNLAWAAWIIARLGGWHCYTKSEGPPGPVILARGLKKFHEMFCGWNLYKLMSAE